MTALDSGWLSANKGKGDQGRLRIYGTTDPFYSLSDMQDTVSKEWTDQVREELDEGDGDEEEEDEEEVFSRLNSLSDSEDGMFNLSKTLVSSAADDTLQQQMVSAQQQQFGFQKIHRAPQPLNISPVARVNNGSEEVAGFDVVDVDPLYALGSAGSQLEEQRSLSVDYSLLQSIGADNTFPMHEGEVLNVPQQQNNTAISWNSGIFDNWCNSVDPVAPATYQQKQQHRQGSAPQNMHQRHHASQEQTQTVQPISQHHLQQQHVQQQIMEHMNQIQQQCRLSKTGLNLPYDGSPQSAGRVYKRSKSVCAGIVSNDSGNAVGPAISMSLHQPHGIVGSTSRGLKQSGNHNIGSHGNVNHNHSSSSSHSSNHSHHSSASSISAIPIRNDFRRGSCSSLYEIRTTPQSIITHAPNLAPHGSHHPALYKYVAQAQLSMQCDTTKVEMENKAQWLSVSPMTTERKTQIIRKLQEKNVVLDTVYEVFELFPQQQYLPEKLEILAMEFESHFSKLRGTEETEALVAEDSNLLNKWIWLDQRKKRHPGQLKQFPRHTVCASSKGNEWPYEIEVRTSSGYNDFTSNSNSESSLTHLDFLLLRLRHMNLLRESDDRKRKNKYYEFIEGKMKRPLNSFMLYRSSLMKALSILKVVKIVSDLVAVVQKELSSLDELAVLKLLQETVKYRRGLAYQESIHIPRLSEIIEQQLYKQPDSRASSHINAAQTGSKGRIPIDPKFSNHTVLAQVITLMWNSELNHCREEFVKFSKLEKDHHHLVYPKYKYCPVKKLKLEELEHNVNVRSLSSDLLDSFKNANTGS